MARQTKVQRTKEWSQRRSAQRAKAKGQTEDLKKIREFFRKNGVNLEHLGSVKTFQLKKWEVAAKVGGKGEKRLESKTLQGATVVLEPSWETGPEYPLVQPAKPVSIRVPKRTGPTLLTKNWKTCVFLPDTQIGFRRLADGSLDPFHDADAINIALQVVEAERPDKVVWAGDFLDLAPMSLKFRQEAGFTQTVQPALDVGYAYLATVNELTDNQYLISGNHDIRLQNFIVDNALHAFGLRPGGTPPDTWPDLSIQHLLRLDEVACKYVGAYPAGAKYLNDNLAAIHGAKIGARQRTAAQVVVEDERVSVLFGHVHKRCYAAKTRNLQGRNAEVSAYSPGCLCRTDGAVPSTKSGMDAFGKPVVQFEDWQQGLGVIRYEEGNGRHKIEDVPIIDHWAQHRGQDFYPKGSNALRSRRKSRGTSLRGPT